MGGKGQALAGQTFRGRRQKNLQTFRIPAEDHVPAKLPFHAPAREHATEPFARRVAIDRRAAGLSPGQI
jgi:hypothetical protein